MTTVHLLNLAFSIFNLLSFSVKKRGNSRFEWQMRLVLTVLRLLTSPVAVLDVLYERGSEKNNKLNKKIKKCPLRVLFLFLLCGSTLVYLHLLNQFICSVQLKHTAECYSDGHMQYLLSGLDY